jgi:4-alpha-glucanotransferase
LFLLSTFRNFAVRNYFSASEMKLKFSINYRTEWGQSLVVELRYIGASGAERRQRLPMLTQDGEVWTAETAVLVGKNDSVRSFSYLYIVEDSEGHELRREWDVTQRRYPFDASRTMTFADVWRDIPLNAHLYSRAYRVTTGCSPEYSGAGIEEDKQSTAEAGTHLPFFRKTVLFRVAAPQLLPSQGLAVIGSHPSLGAWNPSRYLPMTHIGGGDWVLTLNADWLALPLEYKYVVTDTESHELTAWEEGDNRIVDGTLADGEVLVAYREPLRLAEKAWRAAGVSVPVFALRSDDSCGVGDFGDLYRFIDWAATVGMRVIQLLPVNDTTTTGQWGDSDPYNITATMRLHPHYMDLAQLPQPTDTVMMNAFRRQRRELNALPYSDYEAVDKVKSAYVKASYESLEGGGGYESLDDFVQQNLHRQLKRAADHAHLLGIALMGDLPIGVSRHSAEVREKQELFVTDMNTGTPPDATTPRGHNWGLPAYQWEEEGFDEWMERRMKWMEQYFDALRIDHAAGYFRMWQIPATQVWSTMGYFVPSLPLTPGEMEYYGLTFRRELLTRPFINDRVVDRLFGIHAQYVRDTFLDRRPYGLYELKEEVGTQSAVYDRFEGKTDENSVWIRDGLCRLVANRLFIEDERHADMFHPRIMAWQEPVFEVLSAEEKEAFMRIYSNYFYQRHSQLWGRTGYERLNALLRSTDMLLCAEDLGMLPDSVEPVLDSLRILSLEVQRMPKQAGSEFAHLDANAVRSVATISTHDMQPLRLWWAESGEQAQRYYTTMLQKQGRAPERLTAMLAEEIVARHLYCPSMLCVLQLQDWLAMAPELCARSPREERINVPGDAYNRWQWRMSVTIEQLQQADSLNAKLKKMIKLSKR